MNTDVIVAQPVFRAILDIVERISIYAEETGKIEVERLLLSHEALETASSKLREGGLFETSSGVDQHDLFLDLKGRVCARTDHYIRLREERDRKGQFLGAEIKAAYPGSRSNPNARPAVDLSLSEDAIANWRELLNTLGFEVEREFRKTRIGGRSKKTVRGLSVELEADRFSSDECNRALAGQVFLTASIETAGSSSEDAEHALDEVTSEIEALVSSSHCAGNYESYYFGVERLPTSERGFGKK